jgi:hypothetical protein
MPRLPLRAGAKEEDFWAASASTIYFQTPPKLAFTDGRTFDFHSSPYPGTIYEGTTCYLIVESVPTPR